MSSDSTKVAVNGALLVEWIRYYSNLGFKVIVYDRDGAQHAQIWASEYARTQGIDMASLDLDYYNYTIRGILDPSRRNMRYDNMEEYPDGKLTAAKYAELKSRDESADHDKTHTLTHCRFEAKALYGVTRVFVSDFDEFLFCPHGKTTWEDQRKHFRRFFKKSEFAGIKQVLFPRRNAFNLTASPKHCMADRVKAGQSIFGCYGSYKYMVGGQFFKGFHLWHTCPLTGYHVSCSYETMRVDCSCVNRLASMRRRGQNRTGTDGQANDCALLHLSTNPNQLRYIPNDHYRDKAVHSLLELQDMGRAAEGDV
jgi:hypothetical protein